MGLTDKRRPDADLLKADELISPRHGFAMSFRDFVPHLMRVLDQLGMSLFARTTFIKYASLICYRALNYNPRCP